MFEIDSILVLDNVPALNAEDAAAHGLAEGEESPWARIKVLGHVKTTTAGIEYVVAPVAFSNLSSPRQVSGDALLDLAYRIEVEGSGDAGKWESPATEVSFA